MSVTFAGAPPMEIDEAFAYRHVLGELEDVLILARYDLPIDGVDGSPDPPLFTPDDWDDLWDADNDSAVKPDADDRYLTPADVLARLETAAGGLLAATHPLSLGQGVVGMYFEEGSLPFTWGDSLFLVLVGNPSTVDGVESGSLAIDWRDTANQDITAEELADSILSLMNDLEQEFEDYEPGDLLTAGFINADGRTLLQGAFPLIDRAAPTAFTISEQIIPIDDFDPGSDQLQAQIDATASNDIANALEGVSGLFELSADFFGITLAFMLAVPLALIVSRISGRGSYGIFAFTGGLIWASMSSFMPVIFLLLVAGIFFAIGGIWLATKLPM